MYVFSVLLVVGRTSSFALLFRPGNLPSSLMVRRASRVHDWRVSILMFLLVWPMDVTALVLHRLTPFGYVFCV